MSTDQSSFLALIESVGEVAGTLDMLRNNLVEKGWDDLQAQKTAAMVLDNAMKTNIAEIQTRGTKR